MTEKTKAQRRHDAERLRAKRAKTLSFTPTPRQLGRHAQTPKACSCWMCGNPRKFLGERTVQEQRFLATSQEYFRAPVPLET